MRWSALLSLPRFIPSPSPLSVPALPSPRAHSHWDCAADTEQYLVTCRASQMAHIRARETTFYEISAQTIDGAIGKDERLFDGMRAATLLASWLYGMGRYSEVSRNTL